MKTSKMFITRVTALAMASCNNDKEFANQPELEMQVPEAYASFSISIPHTSGTRSVTTRSTEPGTDAENIVKSLHIFIYDKEAPFTSTHSNKPPEILPNGLPLGPSIPKKRINISLRQ